MHCASYEAEKRRVEQEAQNRITDVTKQHRLTGPQHLERTAPDRNRNTWEETMTLNNKIGCLAEITGLL